MYRSAFWAWSSAWRASAAGVGGQVQADLKPIVEIMNGHPVVRGWLAILHFLAYFVWVVMILSGVGLLLMRSWGRIFALLYGVYGIYSACASLLIYALFVFGPLQRLANNAADAQTRAMATIFLMSMVVGWVLMLIYPLVVTILLTRPSMARAFQEWEPRDESFDFPR